MRVALTHAFSWPEVRRGAERLVAELSSALAALGHDVTVLSSAFEPSRRRGEITEVRLRRRHDDVIAAERAFGHAVLPALLAGRFDVVHSHGRHDGRASLRAARYRRRRATVHTDIGIPLRSWWKTQGPEAAIAERVVRDVDAYACMSQHSLAVLRSDYAREGVLLPGGVDLATFRPGPSRSPEPTLLFSGSLETPRKGLATLLAALPLVAREEPAVRLRLSGPGDPGPLLAAAPAGVAERVDLLGTGSLVDQPGRYAEAWVCALPSENETFGLVLIEALACGTPVVGADHAALPELVVPGTTGALCRYGDAEDLARACLEAIALAREPGTADACRESVRGYDWRTAIAPRAIEVYEAALGGRR